MIAVPFAHLGHALPMLPFFAPPLVLILGGLFLMVRDRLRGGERERYEPSQEPRGGTPAASASGAYGDTRRRS